MEKDFWQVGQRCSRFVVVERGMSGGVYGVVFRWGCAPGQWGTCMNLYRCESQGGPLRIFAHDLDLPLMLSPKYWIRSTLNCYCLRAIAWVCPTNRVAVKLEKAASDLPLAESVAILSVQVDKVAALGPNLSRHTQCGVGWPSRGLREITEGGAVQEARSVPNELEAVLPLRTRSGEMSNEDHDELMIAGGGGFTPAVWIISHRM